MTPAKRDKLLEGQSSIAKKVYECVPIQDAWSASQINSQMAGNHAFSAIKGVLDDLKSQGLVKEISGRRFKRAEVSETMGSLLEEAQIQAQKSGRWPKEEQRQPYKEMGKNFEKFKGACQINMANGSTTYAPPAQPGHELKGQGNTPKFELSDDPVNKDQEMAQESPACVGHSKPLVEDNSPLSRLAILAHDMRKSADEYRAAIEGVCVEMESIALDMQIQHNESLEQSEKVRKLVRALKDLED